MGAQGVLGTHIVSVDWPRPLTNVDCSWSAIHVWACVGGEQRVEEVLLSLLANTEVSLGLSGYKSIEEIWAKVGSSARKGVRCRASSVNLEQYRTCTSN
jgi:hypothetical protein